MGINRILKRRRMHWQSYLASVHSKSNLRRSKDYFTCSILENSEVRGIRIVLKKCQIGQPAKKRSVGLKLELLLTVSTAMQKKTLPSSSVKLLFFT